MAKRLTVSWHGAAVVLGTFNGAAPALGLAAARGESRYDLIIYRHGLRIVAAGIIKLV